MKKLLLPAIALLATVAFVFVLFKPAFAWTYDLSGKAECVNFEWKVTWSLTNPENETFTIQSSSRPSVSGTVPANSTSTYTETVTTDVSLTVTGDFPSDSTPRTRSADVKLVGECKKPEVKVVVPPSVKQLPNTGIKE